MKRIVSDRVAQRIYREYADGDCVFRQHYVRRKATELGVSTYVIRSICTATHAYTFLDEEVKWKKLK